MDAVVVKLLALAGLLVLMSLVWADSLRRKDVSVVDRWWGLLFVVLAWTYALAADADGARRWLLPVLTTIWGVRLAGYITWRNWGHGEDKRYAAMRAKDPEGFPRRSLVTVFWGQAALAWVIAAPLFYPHFVADPPDLWWLDAVGVTVWAVGLFFEAVGDWQLSRFLADPDNRGRVLDTGLWRWTRHPNYFGDVTVWVGYAIIATAAGAWWSWYGTALMAAFIVKVSGVAMTDRNMARSGSKRAGYDEYVRRTNAFFPGPRKD